MRWEEAVIDSAPHCKALPLPALRANFRLG